MVTADPALAAADKEVRRALEAVLAGRPAILVDSPPGAGKSWLASAMAAIAVGELREGLVIACFTNRAARELALRTAHEYPAVPVIHFAKEQEAVPLEKRPPNLTVATEGSQVSAMRAAVVVGTAAKIAMSSPGPWPWLVVDEAYQIDHATFFRLAPKGDRIVMIGDPGQLPPVVSVDVTPWETNPTGPQIASQAAARTLLKDPVLIQLPVTRRLRPDTAALVQTSFYPGHVFGATQEAAERRLSLRPENGSSVGRWEPVWRALTGVKSIVAVDLPAANTGGHLDLELAEAAAEAVAELAQLWAASAPFGSSIGVVATHVVQVGAIAAALRRRLGPEIASRILVETVERWQGGERDVMIVQHPLSGITELGAEFDLHPGRLCVMLSRARVATLVLGRTNIDEVLAGHIPEGDRGPGQDDTEHLGWLANVTFRGWLQEHGQHLGIMDPPSGAVTLSDVGSVASARTRPDGWSSVQAEASGPEADAALAQLPSTPSSASPKAGVKYRVGDRVRHAEYGEGLVLESGDVVRIQFGSGSEAFVKRFRSGR